MPRKSWYVIHRWLALVVGLQLLAWSLGGFVFSVLDIDVVRGDADRADTWNRPLAVERVKLSPAEAVGVVRHHGDDATIGHVRLRERFESTVYELFGLEGEPLCAVDATDGRFLRSISAADAQRVALHDFASEARVRSVELIEEKAPQE